MVIFFSILLLELLKDKNIKKNVFKISFKILVCIWLVNMCTNIGYSNMPLSYGGWFVCVENRTTKSQYKMKKKFSKTNFCARMIVSNITTKRYVQYVCMCTYVYESFYLASEILYSLQFVIESPIYVYYTQNSFKHALTYTVNKRE